MNERIRQLAAQAGATVNERSGYTDYGTHDLDVEKFAELIVEECIASIPSDGHRGDFLRGVEFCQLKIKAQFGIAE